MGGDVMGRRSCDAVRVSATAEVREACRRLAAEARQVRIVPEALDAVPGGPVPALDPGDHFVDGSPAEVAAYVLALDAVNFGSGWFAELPGLGYETVARSLAGLWRSGGGWDAAALREVDAPAVGALLGRPPAHELIGLFAAALRELGTWLGDRTALEVVRACEPSADRLVAALAQLPMWADRGFLKRAQIAASDLVLAGVARFDDAHELTAFADNVLPQVLRAAGVLEVDPALAARIDAGEELPPGGAEAELRACAVHAVELIAPRVGLTPRELDNVLWTRGRRLTTPPPHRTRTTFY